MCVYIGYEGRNNFDLSLAFMVSEKADMVLVGVRRSGESCWSDGR